jgi:hypothetical protein
MTYKVICKPVCAPPACYHSPGPYKFLHTYIESHLYDCAYNFVGSKNFVGTILSPKSLQSFL